MAKEGDKVIKRFFRINLKRVILTLIIFSAFIHFINYDTGIRCITQPCPTTMPITVLDWIILSNQGFVYGMSYLNLVIGIIISFLISSIIFYLYGKIKGKIKKTASTSRTKPIKQKK
jgi:hypothetical protein